MIADEILEKSRVSFFISVSVLEKEIGGENKKIVVPILTLSFSQVHACTEQR